MDTRIGRIKDPKQPTMAVTLGAVGSGLKEQAYRRDGCRSWRNMSQLVGADGGDDAGVCGSGQEKGACRWHRFEEAGPLARWRMKSLKIMQDGRSRWWRRRRGRW